MKTLIILFIFPIYIFSQTETSPNLYSDTNKGFWNTPIKYSLNINDDTVLYKNIKSEIYYVNNRIVSYLIDCSCDFKPGDKIKIYRISGINKIVTENNFHYALISDNVISNFDKKNGYNSYKERYNNTYIKQSELDEYFWSKKTADSIIKIYGNSTFKMILNKEVKLGWSKNLCKLSWGEPSDINKTITSEGTSEQWVYSLSSYLYFKNGKLTTIQN